ncbi:sulfotransferase [Dyella soli]|uniref:Sulfotransferase family protein n=1 Tax=Dyella soli TaxID=522319 RepID=A0A4R0YK44_9GAMM|nr:sulfotransferase [Dyella soli]TCI08881.1 sulfotransferase family protein [Dyella soli]
MNDSVQLYEQALAAFNRRDWRQALDLCSRVLPQAPQHAGLHYITGIATLELQLLPAAARHLGQACQLEPDNSMYAAQYARLLSIARLTNESLAAADRAMALSPREPVTLDTLGVVYTQGHAHARAAAAFRQATTLAPGEVHHRYNLATALIATGDLDEAEQALETCIAMEPRWWRAHLTLAHLRKARPDRHHLPRLLELLPRADGDAHASMYMHLALAKEFEDLGDYDQSFRHLAAGKAAGGQTRQYAISRDEALFEALIRAFPAPEADTAGFASDAPVFIIGMPRSGTTLVERIISSHPDVQSAGELQNFGMVLKRASGSNTPFLLDPLTIARARNLDWQGLGRAYIDSTRSVAGSRKHFIDKLPHNFLYAGFIARALPQARIICLRRDPMDTCLSNFRQLFALTGPYYDYSFDLLDTARYYALFDRLMAHWQRVLPGRILEVRYEDLVDDQEAESRRIIAHCGLAWDDACLDFHANQAPVATASAVQVREPMYRTSLARWKRYGAHLDGLQQVLREAGIPLES